MRTLLQMTCLVASLYLLLLSCNKAQQKIPHTPDPNPVQNDIDVWFTKADASILLEKQTTARGFTTAVNAYPAITVDSAVSYQAVDGFGYSLTGGSALMINRMNNSARSLLLEELFRCDNTKMCISYLRGVYNKLHKVIDIGRTFLLGQVAVCPKGKYILRRGHRPHYCAYKANKPCKGETMYYAPSGLHRL